MLAGLLIAALGLAGGASAGSLEDSAAEAGMSFSGRLASFTPEKPAASPQEGEGKVVEPFCVLEHPDVRRGMRHVERPFLLDLAFTHVFKVIRKASANSPPEFNRKLGRIEEVLKKKNVVWAPPDYDLSTCNGELAHVYPGDGRIFLCQGFFASGAYGMAQILIHEAAHVLGELDECAATKIELEALRRAGECPPFPNGYVAEGRCPWQSIER